MSIPVHEATIEEVFDDEGDRAFRAACLETGAVCDAWGFPDIGIFDGGAFFGPEDERDGAAIERALEYLSDPRLHERGSASYCDARHVLP